MDKIGIVNGALAQMLSSQEAHGGRGEAFGRLLGVGGDSLLDLSASLSPCPVDFETVLAKYLNGVRRYPDPNRARCCLAEAIGVEVDNLVLTNGGAEAIACVASHVGTARLQEPEFSLYERHLDRVDPAAPTIRSNPNNPTGKLADKDDQALVWDEAFYQLATGTWTRGDIEDGCIVIGSLTKLLGCPGLRIGYVISKDDKLVAELGHRLPAWNVNSLVCDSLEDLLGLVDLEQIASKVGQLRDYMTELLEGFGLSYIGSDANYLCVRAPNFNRGLMNKLFSISPYEPIRVWSDQDSTLSSLNSKGRLFRNALVSQGVIVRDCDSFGMPDYVRVAVCDRGDLALLEKALEILGEYWS